MIQSCEFLLGKDENRDDGVEHDGEKRHRTVAITVVLNYAAVLVGILPWFAIKGLLLSAILVRVVEEEEEEKKLVKSEAEEDEGE